MNKKKLEKELLIKTISNLYIAEAVGIEYVEDIASTYEQGPIGHFIVEPEYDLKTKDIVGFSEAVSKLNIIKRSNCENGYVDEDVNPINKNIKWNVYPINFKNSLQVSIVDEYLTQTAKQAEDNYVRTLEQAYKPKYVQRQISAR